MRDSFACHFNYLTKFGNILCTWMATSVLIKYRPDQHCFIIHNFFSGHYYYYYLVPFRNGFLWMFHERHIARHVLTNRPAIPQFIVHYFKLIIGQKRDVMAQEYYLCCLLFNFNILGLLKRQILRFKLIVQNWYCIRY